MNYSMRTPIGIILLETSCSFFSPICDISFKRIEAKQYPSTYIADFK